MPVYDQRLESQEQKTRPSGRTLDDGKIELGEIDHSHPYYGPDSFAMQLRDQPQRRGFWQRWKTFWRKHG
ncbi:MAG TPA: hypothetical protein VIH99_04220 [Bdellovibrionota bacterium]|jgi:hypothetical protein